jgi:hypothetical protein
MTASAAKKNGIAGRMLRLFGRKVQSAQEQTIKEPPASFSRAFFPYHAASGLLENLRTVSHGLQKQTPGAEQRADLSGLVPTTGCLHIKQGYRLTEYLPDLHGLFRRGGRIAVYTPGDDRNRTFTENDLCFDEQRVMSAIDGDGSPWSYFCAALLVSELREFGAYGPAQWCTHSLWKPEPGSPVVPDGDRPGDEPHDDGNPCVVANVDAVSVVFHTFSELYGARIYRHCVSFKRGSYVPMSSDSVVVQEMPGAGYSMY